MDDINGFADHSNGITDNTNAITDSSNGVTDGTGVITDCSNATTDRTDGTTKDSNAAGNHSYPPYYPKKRGFSGKSQIYCSRTYLTKKMKRRQYVRNT